MTKNRMEEGKSNGGRVRERQRYREKEREKIPLKIEREEQQINKRDKYAHRYK